MREHEKSLSTEFLTPADLFEKIQPSILLVLFFFSGISALIYQIVWMRMFSLVFGVTTLAVSTVLTSFMAGLALGSYLGGRWADRFKNPLRFFSYLELGIGAFALFFPIFLSGLTNIYIMIHQNLSTNFYLFSIIRFFLAFVLLLIPTMLMGGTLPVLAKTFIKGLKGLGMDMGHLYSVNNWGSVLGILVAGFFLMEKIGVQQTSLLAAFFNIGIGLIALLLSIRSFGKKESRREGSQARESIGKEREAIIEGSGQRYPRYILNLVLWVFAIEGFTSLVYEVLWIRILSAESFLNTVYSFSLVVAVFISGLALGSFIIARFVDRRKNLLALFGFIELAIGVSALMVLPLFQKVPFWSIGLMMRLFGKMEFWNISLTKFILLSAVMIVPTTLMGMTFPLISKIYTINFGELGHRIGILGCLDVIGSIFGAFMGGFVIIKFMGLQKGVISMAFLNMALGGILLLFHPYFRIKARVALATSLIFAFLIAFEAIPHKAYFWGKAKMTDPLTGEKIFKLLDYREDLDGTVTVSQKGDGSRLLEINGLDVAGTSLDLKTTQKAQGHLPLLLYESTTGLIPKDILLVGLGSGGTSWSVSQHPVQSITCVELVSSVKTFAKKYFQEVNHNVFDDPRYHLIIEDGRNYMLTSDKKYDAILTESVHPAYVGNANLYSKEYFELCRSHLREKGVVSVWIPMWRLSEDDIKMIIKTFLQVFPDASLWYMANEMNLQFILMGTNYPQKIHFERFVQFLKEEKIQKDFNEIYLGDPFQLLSFHLLDREALARYSEGARVHSENHPYLEFSGAKSWYLLQEVTNKNFVSLSQKRSSIMPYIEHFGQTEEERAANEKRLRRSIRLTGITIEGIVYAMMHEPDKAVSKHIQALKMEPDDIVSRHFLKKYLYHYLNSATWYDRRGQYRRAIAFYEKILKIDEEISIQKELRMNIHPMNLLLRVGTLYLNQKNVDEAIKIFQGAIEKQPDNALAHLQLGKSYEWKGWREKAEREYQKVAELDPSLRSAQK